MQVRINEICIPAKVFFFKHCLIHKFSSLQSITCFKQHAAHKTLDNFCHWEIIGRLDLKFLFLIQYSACAVFFVLLFLITHKFDLKPKATQKAAPTYVRSQQSSTGIKLTFR